MRVFSVQTVVLVFGLAAFAGCVESESATAPPPAQQAAGPASFDETSGGIEGSVTDTELQPVANAVVGILPSETVTQAVQVLTDGAGHFSLSHVAPGKQTLQATALGYSSDAKSIEVVAGSVVTVAFII